MGLNRDFVMEPNGLCFFCLKRAEPLLTQAKREPEVNPADNPTFPIYSVQCLSRFLKMDIRKVFKDQELIPQQLLAKVDNSALKVELCDECAQLIDKFSQLQHNLEKIRIEVVSSLSNIYERFLEAKGEIKSEGLNKLDGEKTSTNSEDLWSCKLDILEILRTEAIQKCHAKINSTTPRIKMENLTMKKVRRKRHKLRKNSSCSAVTQLSPSCNIYSEADISDFNIGIEKIKEEYPIENLDYCDRDDISTYSDDFEKRRDEPTPSSKQNAEEPIPAAVEDLAMPNNRIPKYRRKVGNRKKGPTDSCTVATSRSPKVGKPIFNQKAGKYYYGCPLCPYQSKFPSNLKIHYDGVHEKIKYKCRLCSKEFSQKANYNLHYRVSHTGVRVKCPVCKSLFARKFSLQRHQRDTRCGKGNNRKPK